MGKTFPRSDFCPVRLSETSLYLCAHSPQPGQRSRKCKEERSGVESVIGHFTGSQITFLWEHLWEKTLKNFKHFTKDNQDVYNKTWASHFPFFACQFKMTRSQLGIYCLTMHRKTDVEQIEICLCLGQISLAVSGGGACGGRNGGARWRPVGGILPRFKQVFFFKKKSFISYSPKTSRIYLFKLHMFWGAT